jgi:hypothetical protein
MQHASSLLIAAGVLLAAPASTAAAAQGVPLTVTVTGKVEYNQVSAPPLGNAVQDDPAELSFSIDSSDFQNSASFPTRGYVIDLNSFQLTLGSTTIGLQNPFPAGTQAYFVLRDDDPGVDGFFVATSLDFPIGVPIDQVGAFGQFLNNFSVTYGKTLLSSLDVLDALGTYDFTGLQVYNWTVDDGPFNPVGIAFAQMTIECEPQPPVIYCQGKLNSQGCTPTLSTDPGSPSLSGGPWHIKASDLINNKTGIFFYGFGSKNAPFQGGTMCVASPVFRTAPQDSGGNPPPDDCSGTMSLDLVGALPAGLAPAWVNVQVWARDPADPFGTGLSNAVEVLVCP